MKDFLHGVSNAEGILSYVKKHTEPLSTKIECDQIDTKVKDQDLFSLMYFGKESEILYSAVFMELAKFELDETQFNFFHNDDYYCAQKYEVQQPSVILFRKGFTNNTLTYKGKHALQEFSTWAKTHLVPIIFEIEDKHDSIVMG